MYCTCMLYPRINCEPCCATVNGGATSQSSGYRPLEESRSNLFLSTASFVGIISTVTGKDIGFFVEQWVTQPGHVRLVGQFNFNRKRNVIEFTLQQDMNQKGSMRYAGPINVTVQELDGSFNHTFKVEEQIKNSYDIPCHSKSRKNKKKKIPLITGEEVDMDHSRMDADSPVLWVRIDVDMLLLRSVIVFQPDFMWQLMLRYERDPVAQIQALEGLEAYPSRDSQPVLQELIQDDKQFHRVRTLACDTLCRLVTALGLNSNVSHASGAAAAASQLPLVSTFRHLYGADSCRMLVRQNDFSRFQDYFLQKAIPLAIAQLRNRSDVCPPEAVCFLLDLLKYNDNSRNSYSDCYYRAALLEALRITITPSMLDGMRCAVGGGSGVTRATELPTEVRLILDAVKTQLNMERVVPSYKLMLTVVCLKSLRKLQRYGYLRPDIQLFQYFARHGNFFEVRLAALQAIVDYVRTDKDSATLEWLLESVVGGDPDPQVSTCAEKAQPVEAKSTVVCCCCCCMMMRVVVGGSRRSKAADLLLI